jgi:hypothetical protein
VRIHLERIEYTAQAKIIAALDRNYRFAAFGIDRGGNGLSVLQMLSNNREFADLPERRERFLGFDFGESLVIEVDEDTGKETKQNAKEFSTSVLNRYLRRRFLLVPKQMRIEEKLNPGDDLLEEQFVSHTYTKTDRHITYSKGNDHVVDAYRVLALARETVTRLHDLTGGYSEGECVGAVATGAIF